MSPIVDCSSVLPRDTEHFVDIVHYTDHGAARIAQVVHNEICKLFDISLSN